MAEKERMFGFSIEAAIGRLFTDRKFLEMARAHPDAAALAYNLGPKETKGFKDIVSKFDAVSAVELAKGTVASGYGCSGGGDT
jgi:hypothetical protein